MTLEADPAAGPGDVYDMLDLHFRADRFPRDGLAVTPAAFTVRYRPADGGRQRSLTFEVSLPNGCDLRSLPEEQRAVGERCLRQWRILQDEPGLDPVVRGRVA